MLCYNTVFSCFIPAWQLCGWPFPLPCLFMKDPSFTTHSRVPTVPARYPLHGRKNQHRQRPEDGSRRTVCREQGWPTRRAQLPRPVHRWRSERAGRSNNPGGYRVSHRRHPHHRHRRRKGLEHHRDGGHRQLPLQPEHQDHRQLHEAEHVDRHRWSRNVQLWVVASVLPRATKMHHQPTTPWNRLPFYALQTFSFEYLVVGYSAMLQLLGVVYYILSFHQWLQPNTYLHLALMQLGEESDKELERSPNPGPSFQESLISVSMSSCLFFLVALFMKGWG